MRESTLTCGVEYHAIIRRRVSLDGIAEFALIAVLAYTVVWQGGKSLVAVWLVSFLAGALTLLDAWTSRGQKEKGANGWMWWGLILFVLLTVVSFTLSLTRNYGLDEVFATLAQALIFFWTVRHVSRRPVFASRMLRTLSVALIVACAIGIPVYVLQPVSRFVGSFFNYRFHTDYWPNAWAELVLLLWPMLLWTLFWRQDGRQRGSGYLKASLLGLVLGCLLLSFSRGGVIAFAGQGLLAAALILPRLPRTSLKRVILLALVSLAAACIVFAGFNQMRSRFHAVESVARKATFSSDEGASSVSERAQFWRQALELTVQHPWFGWGPYSFRFVQPHLQKNVLATSDHPHNVFLKFAMERGVLVSLLFLAVLGMVFVRGIRSAIAKKFSGTAPMDALLVVAIAGIVVHNLIDYNLQFMGIALPFWVGVGIIVAHGSAPERSRRMRRGVEVLLALALLGVAFYEGMFLFYSSRARKEEAAGRPLVALTWYRLTDDALFQRDQWLSRSLIELSQGRLSEALKDCEAALALNAQDARAWRLLGEITLRQGDRRQSLSAYTRAYAFGRYNDIGIVRGFVEATAHGGKTLDTNRRDVDALLNDFGMAILKNLHFVALSRNVEELSSLAEFMVQLYPEDREAYRSLARRITDHALSVRRTYASRARGALW